MEECSESSVTDSFSEDELDYSPVKLDTMSVPESLLIDNHTTYSNMTLTCHEMQTYGQEAGNQLSNRLIESLWKMAKGFWIGCQAIIHGEQETQSLEELIENMIKNCLHEGLVETYPKIEQYLNEEAQIVIEKLKQTAQVKSGSFIYLSRSLAVILSIEDVRLRFPPWVLLDVCLFSLDHSITVLTVVSRDISESEREICKTYNTYVASWLIKALREADDTVSVLNGVVDVNSDISPTLDKLRRQKLFFAFEESILMTHKRCETNLKSFLRLIGSCKTFQFWTNTIEQRNGELNAEEFNYMINTVERASNGNNMAALAKPFVVELISRISRGFRLRLVIDDPEILHDNMIDELMSQFPLIHIDDKMPCHYEIHVKHVGQQSVWSFIHVAQKDMLPGKQHGISSHECKMEQQLKKYQHDKWKQQNQQVVKTFPEVSWGGICFILLQFLVLIWRFLQIYDSEILESWQFAAAKCMPMFYLVSQLFGHRSELQHNHRCLYLILGLICSCIGDVLFVWKRVYLNHGICVFATAHVLYACAFDFRLDNFKTFGLFSILAAVIFSYFSVNLQGMTYYVLLLYTLSVSLMGWRALADVRERKDFVPWKYFSLVSVFCFVFCNIVFGFELFKAPFTGSHVISMITYYGAQLGLTLSVLFKYEMTEVFSDVEAKTKIFAVSAIVNVICCIMEPVPV